MSSKTGELVECDRCHESEFLEMDFSDNGCLCDFTDEAQLELDKWLQIELPFGGEMQEFCLCPKCKAELFNLLNNDYWCH